MARKSTGKRTRFEVFKRDAFTCQYCGCRPPDVILVVDHVHPVAEGGTDEITNLITACEACNGGKSSIPLGAVVVRPDADLMWYETQQEILELRRFNEAVAARQAAMAETYDALAQVWATVTPNLDWEPSRRDMQQMLTRFSPGLVAQAFEIVGPKVNRGEIAKGWIPYTWGVLKNLAKAHAPAQPEAEAKEVALEWENYQKPVYVQPAFIESLLVRFTPEIVGRAIDAASLEGLGCNWTDEETNAAVMRVAAAILLDEFEVEADDLG